MKKALIICMLLCSYFIYAQNGINIERTPMSQNDFRNFIIQKYKTFESQKSEKKFPKFKMNDLKELLSYVPFEEDGKFFISAVRPMEGMDKYKIYDKAYQAIVDMFVNAKDVIQMNDKNTGIIICKGTTSGIFSFKDFLIGIISTTQNVNFTMKIQIKGGRYKIDIYNIELEFMEYAQSLGSGPIEIMLSPKYYTMTYAADGLGVSENSKTNSNNVNLQTQLLISAMSALYNIEFGIFKKMSSAKNSDNW